MHIDVDDILLNKASIIERCIKRIREEYDLSPGLDNFTHLDALTLNIERACQASIDMAMHIVAVKHFGIPQTSAGAFELLYKNKIIDKNIFNSLKAMTGFRNIAIHEYQTLDNEIIRYISEKGYKDFVLYCTSLNLKIKV
jgi:uncharacterized protein YutE (UPF0331/DUF86 family)